jgi:TRAP-type C4-dicarboxylate transport system substrate-binding protein
MGNRILTTKPVRSVDDLKGMKIRALGTFADWVAKLGASPVNVPMTEIYMALKLGTIDGACTGFDVHYDQKHDEVGKYIVGTPRASFAEPLHILINLELWNSLSEELRTILTLTARDWSIWTGMTIEMQRMQKVIDGFEDRGVEFTTLSAADTAKMQAAAVEVWDEWAQKDDYSSRGVKIMKDLFKEQGRIK